MLKERKAGDLRKVEVDDELSNQTCIMVVGDNFPEKDIIRRERLAFDGYNIPIIKEKDICKITDYKNSVPKRYSKPMKDFELTYDRLFVSRFSPIVHLNFHEGENTLRGKRVYFLRSEHKHQDVLIECLEKMGAVVTHDFDPWHTDFCILKKSTEEKLKRGQRDIFIQTIECKYNSSSRADFGFSFLREMDVVEALLANAEEEGDIKLMEDLNRYKDSIATSLAYYFATLPLCHYTSMNAMSNILRKDKIVLRASNILCMNDEREVKEGLDIARGLVNDIVNEGDKSAKMIALKNILGRIDKNSCGDFYVTSFCEDMDSLPMWIMYADNGRGCIMEFDRSMIDRQFNLAHSDSVFVKCNYNKEEERDSYITYGGKPINNWQSGKKMGMDLLNAIIICVSTKHHGFRQEHEWRGVCLKRKGNNDVLFRLSNMGKVPYIEIELDKKALKKVILGPTCNDSLKNDVKDFLVANDYTHVKVEKSTIPYRG